ncbi:MAG: hypothetical protein ACMX3H_03340 [Sodalis sp. (in: enterobacteria)]
MSEETSRNNESGRIHVTEFRRKYFKNGRYVGTLKASGFGSAPETREE